MVFRDDVLWHSAPGTYAKHGALCEAEFKDGSCPTVPIERDWHEHKGRCYVYLRTDESVPDWDATEKFCVDRGGHLFSIGSREEQLDYEQRKLVPYFSQCS